MALTSDHELRRLADGDARLLELLRAAVDQENSLCGGAFVVTAGALLLEHGESVLPLCASHLVRLRAGEPYDHQHAVWEPVSQALRAFEGAAPETAATAVAIALEEVVRQSGHAVDGVPPVNVVTTICELVHSMAARWATGHDPTACHCEACEDCTEVAADLVDQSLPETEVRRRCAALLLQCRSYVQTALELVLNPNGRVQ